MKPSQLVPGEQGLFTQEAIKKGTIVTWYTGKVYRKYKEIGKIMGVTGPDMVPNGEGQYMFDVPSKQGNKIIAYIDGYQPDPKLGGQERCKGTYINHSRKSPSVEFQIFSVKNLGSYLNRGVAIVATQDIAAKSELLIDYGNAFHRMLVNSGKLKED